VSFQAGGGPASDPGAYTIVGAFDQISGTPPDEAPCGPAVGGCSLCAPADGGVKPGNLMINFVSAGTLTVKDGSNTLATLPFNADAGGTYEIDSDSTATLTWAVGDDLAVSATGGTIPAFSGSITAPSDFAGVTPTFSLLTPVPISESGGFTVTWTPSSDNGSITLVVGVAAEMNRVSIGCTVDESVGQIVVASSLLTQLAGFGDTTGTLTLSKTVKTKVSSEVSLEASPVGLAGTFSFSN
jgi:hypothetical protein